MGTESQRGDHDGAHVCDTDPSGTAEWVDVKKGAGGRRPGGSDRQSESRRHGGAARHGRNARRRAAAGPGEIEVSLSHPFATRQIAFPWYFGAMPIENPFQDPLRFERRVPECAVVIFGANGDLTKRKLLPALYGWLTIAGCLPVSRWSESREPRCPTTTSAKRCRSQSNSSLEDTTFDENIWNAFAPGPVLRRGRHCTTRLCTRLLLPG